LKIFGLDTSPPLATPHMRAINSFLVMMGYKLTPLN
jgi:hypothetical protein